MRTKKLESLEKAELLTLVRKMIEASDDNELLVRSILAGKRGIDVKKYKEQISRALSYDMRKSKYWDLEEAARILRYVEKATDDAMVIADIHVYAAVEGEKITDMFGDIDEDYYCSMEDIYGNAAKWVVAAQKQGNDISDLKESLHQIMQDTRYIGWGHGDEISCLWSEHFEDTDKE
nr:hypothetical protein [uncultured Methanolobus sp.]